MLLDLFMQRGYVSLQRLFPIEGRLTQWTMKASDFFMHLYHVSLQAAVANKLVITHLAAEPFRFMH